MIVISIILWLFFFPTVWRCFGAPLWFHHVRSIKNVWPKQVRKTFSADIVRQPNSARQVTSKILPICSSKSSAGICHLSTVSWLSTTSQRSQHVLLENDCIFVFWGEVIGFWGSSGKQLIILFFFQIHDHDFSTGVWHLEKKSGSTFPNKSYVTANCNNALHRLILKLSR